MSEFHECNIEKILFLDIETTPQYANFTELPEELQTLWEKKAQRLAEPNQAISDIYNKAGIFAEFGKIVCISVGYVKIIDGFPHIRLKSFFCDDEKKIIQEFNALVNKSFSSSSHFLCAHNGKEFDFPYIARRSLILGIPIANCIDTRGLKPWEVKHFDTLELWRFGDYKNYTSLELLTSIFGIPSSKDDITGAQVADVYWKENDLKRIAVYCQKDVLAIIQLFLKFRSLPLVEVENIEYL